MKYANMHLFMGDSTFLFYLRKCLNSTNRVNQIFSSSSVLCSKTDPTNCKKIKCHSNWVLVANYSFPTYSTIETSRTPRGCKSEECAPTITDNNTFNTFAVTLSPVLYLVSIFSTLSSESSDTWHSPT